MFYALVAFVAFLIVRQYHRARTNKANLPPGPRKWPFIGNLFDLPRAGQVEYLHWRDHKDKYGPISSLTVLGQTTILLHDKEAVREVLIAQAAVTSARPYFLFADTLCGFGALMGSQQYNDQFRHQRKLVQQQLISSSAVDEFQDIQELEAARLLIRIVQNPHGIMTHLAKLSAAIVLKMSYGYSVNTDNDDPLVALVEKMMSNFSKAFVPFSWLVDLFPALQYVPEGTPLTAFKHTARQWKKINEAAARVPYEFTCRQMKKGNDYPISFVSKLLESTMQASKNDSIREQDEFSIKWTAAGLYAAGADTTTISLRAFVLLMAKFPKAQDTAYAEITSLTSSSRLPQFSDRESLPYTCGLIKEVIRFSPVVPMGLTHVLEEDISYGGYLLPAGSYLVPATWLLLHDPGVYRDPHEFEPTRYIQPRTEPDPTIDAFGYGRRRCPGRRVADATLFITIAQMLAVLKIRAAGRLENDDTTGINVEPTAGILNHPKLFDVDIELRSHKFVDLIEDLKRHHHWEVGDGDLLEDISIEVTPNDLYQAWIKNDPQPKYVTTLLKDCADQVEALHKWFIRFNAEEQ